MPLLEEVFKNFPDLPINLDIKINNDKLIENVCYYILIFLHIKANKNN